jgi:predicted alpha/beta superfamily hydrolase
MKFLFLLLFSISSLAAYAQLPNVSSGRIQRFDNFKSGYVQSRYIDVWLPQNYDTSKKYAVLYMHDGQMLFDSAITWNHQEWKVDETISSLIKDGKLKDLIVVAIPNNGKFRHAEYFPQRAIDFIPEKEKKKLLSQLEGEPMADNYLKFLVTELKPFVDSTFSTLKDQPNTFICGSSMGGLISMYAVCEYPDVFGGAACLSTHWPGNFEKKNNPIPKAFQDYLKDKLPSPDNHKFYFDYGDKTLDEMYEPYQKKVDEIIKSKAYTDKNMMSKFFPGEDHSEIAWSKRLNIPLLFLLGK